MGLRFTNEVTTEHSGVFIYTTSSALDFYIRKKIKEKLNADGDYILNVATDKELNQAMDNGLIAPMIGDQWIIHVNMEKITVKVLEKVLKRNLPYAYFVFWISDFRLYNKTKQLSIVKRFEQFFPIETLNSLSVEDARFYISDNLKDKVKEIPTNITDFVISNYRYDLKGLSDFIMLVGMGEEFKEQKDVIEAVGVGSISVDTLLFKMLTADASTDKKAKNRLKQLINFFDMLKSKYEPKQILTYLEIGLNNVLLLKELHIMGYLKNHNATMPNYVDMKKLQRYSRFFFMIQTDMTMVDILNLKVLLKKYKDFDAELVFMQIVTEYLQTKQGSTVYKRKNYTKR